MIYVFIVIYGMPITLLHIYENVLMFIRIPSL